MGFWNIKHIVFALIICALIAYPLIFMQNSVSTASDDNGPSLMQEMGYVPWVTYIWQPPSSDMENGLFAMQAAVGGAILGYFLGIFHVQGRIRREEAEKNEKDKAVEQAAEL